MQQIKDKIDVADLIGEYVQLKPAGVNKKGLCPFHHEKTPSFMVSPERKSWHCFGCAKGGDIFTFIEEIEGMEFKEALKYLANKAGVVLTNNFKQEVGGSQRNRLKDINAEAARFFYNFLIKIPSAKLAMDYLIKRGIKSETIDGWQIGYIPEQWDLLTQYLLKKGFAIDDLVASGLTIKRDNADPKTYRGFYDRFRGRIMFPILDAHGDVVGFTGRILVEKENSGGKYVNTPQTVVYDKSRVIFGLNKAKQEIRARNLIVMVEGQMDVIACHQAGMKNVVASSGTALTEEHVKLLKRYSSNINMAFDMDEAGQNAARRGIAIALREGMNIKVIRLPADAGKDPDECLKKNPQIWFEAVEKAQDVMGWYFTKAFTGKDLANHHHKQTISNELLPDIVLIPYAVERDHWLRMLSEKLNVDVAVLREDMARISQKSSKSLPAMLRIALQAGVKLESPSGQIQTNEKIERTPLNMRVERLFGLVFKFPELVEKVMNGGLDNVLSTGRLAPLYEQIKMQYNTNKQIELGKLPPGLIVGTENIVDLLSMQGDWEFADFHLKEAGDELNNLIIILKDEWIKKRHKDLQVEIERAEKAGEKEKLTKLLKEFAEIK